MCLDYFLSPKPQNLHAFRNGLHTTFSLKPKDLSRKQKSKIN